MPTRSKLEDLAHPIRNHWRQSYPRIMAALRPRHPEDHYDSRPEAPTIPRRPSRCPQTETQPVHLFARPGPRADAARLSASRFL